MPNIVIPSKNLRIAVTAGANLLAALKKHGIYPDAPCGGNGQCGKGRVSVDSKDALACQTFIDRDVTITLPQTENLYILHESSYAGQTANPFREGYLLDNMK